MVATTKVIFRKKEATYATDAAPTGAANAAITRNFTAKPVVTDRLARNRDSNVRGRTKDAPSNVRATFGYELEAAGSGTPGTAPAWMEDLEACGMAAPVLTAGASAVQRFAPIGAALSSLTAYHFHGNQRRINIGARGTFSFDFTAGAEPVFKLDFTGLLPATADFGISDAAPGAITLDQWKDPVEVNDDNTDFTLGGYAAVLRAFTGDVGAEVKLRSLVGARYVNRGNHAITGRIVCEAPTIGAKNYFRTLKAGDEIPVQLIHGTVAGNIVQLDGAHLQITEIDLQEEDDTLMLSIAYGLNVGTTPDDLVITAK